MTAVKFTVEISRGDRWGPMAYWLYMRPAPRWGTTMRSAWSRAGAERKARRWIHKAESIGPKQPTDTFVVATVEANR